MAAPPSGRLQSMLQAAVQSVQWTYSIFWKFNTQHGILMWADGYYNGPIKTRKTVQSVEVSTEEASLQRSQQLRELYESLSAGETNQPARRPCAALSPEDLTESEWFYLMCVSFSFPPGVGLPGKAYARRQHVWLTGANEVDSKTFSRAILAKSAQVQTVVCIPLLDGVVELGNIDRVEEDPSFEQHIKSFFADHHPPPKPALSEHSTSNPTTSSNQHPFHSPPIPSMYVVADPPAESTPANPINEDMEEEDDNDEGESDSEAETGRPNSNQNPAATPMGAEPSELMQLEMSEDIRLGSPEDGSNNLDSDFHLLSVSLAERQVGAESSRRWSASNLGPQAQQPPPSVAGAEVVLEEELSQEDTHYSQTVSVILQTQTARCPESNSSFSHVTYSMQSAFTKWTHPAEPNLLHPSLDGTSQWLLKYMLFTVPLLHTKYRDDNSPSPRDGTVEATARMRKGTPQDELSANHVLAERRRREKLNERFIILRSLVPFVTKMDKASILGDTIEYVKQLRKRIQDLEACNRHMEVDHRGRPGAAGEVQLQRSSSSKDLRSGITEVDRTKYSSTGPDRRKMRAVEGSGGTSKTKTMEVSPPPPSPSHSETITSVQVSIIESDALLELQCPYKEGLLLDVMQLLRGLRIETTAVQSTLNNGMFVAELRAKVKENVHGKKANIVEVKRAIKQIIPHTD